MYRVKCHCDSLSSGTLGVSECLLRCKQVPSDRSWAEEPSLKEMLACFWRQCLMYKADLKHCAIEANLEHLYPASPLMSVGITGLPHHTHFKTLMKYTFKKRLCFHLHSQLRFSRCLTTSTPAPDSFLGSSVPLSTSYLSTLVLWEGKQDSGSEEH